MLLISYNIKDDRVCEVLLYGPIWSVVVSFNFI